jgi:hypothetical protein
VSTRGYITFIIDGQPKHSYNHDNSGPDGLGLHVLEWLRYADPARLIKDIKNLQTVLQDRYPTEDQFHRIRAWYNAETARWAELGRGLEHHPEDQQHDVGQADWDEDDPEDWYSLLRGTQGDPAAILAVGYAASDRDDDRYSVMAEWAYTINADTRTLAVGHPDPGIEWPWDNLPDDTAFLAACARLIP